MTAVKHLLIPFIYNPPPPPITPITIQAWTGPEGSRRLRLPYFQMISGKVVSSIHQQPLPRKKYKTLLVFISVRGGEDPRAKVQPEGLSHEKFQWHHHELNPWPSSLYSSASTNCITTCPLLMVTNQLYQDCEDVLTTHITKPSCCHMKQNHYNTYYNSRFYAAVLKYLHNTHKWYIVMT